MSLTVGTTGSGGSGRLWAITSYYNPMHWRSRLANYRVFRERLGVPLIAVELAADGAFELEQKDSDILVRTRRGDLMWQKERLLNLALTNLPSGCVAVAWIDCDVVFERPDWERAALEELRRLPLLHLFDRVRHLERGQAPGTAGEPTDAVDQCSIVSAIRHEGSLDACMEPRAGRRRRFWSSGMAWAASRGILEEHGFYDRCIVGGGDLAMVGAAFGATERVMGFHRMSQVQRACFARWADPFRRSVRGRVGIIPGTIEHLWHGGLGARRYLSRHQRLAVLDYDPERDVADAGDGGLEWATHKPDLHEYLRAYFASRHEDGVALVRRAPACES